VTEEGAPQKLSLFNKRDGRVTYGFAIDASGSLRKYIDQVIATAKTIIAQGGPSEEAFVESFIDSDRINTAQEFTSDKNSLEDALDSIYVEGGQSAVIDGVYLAVQHLMEYKSNEPQRRRSLILITDGEDRASHHTQEELFKLLHDSDIRIYVIGFVHEIETQKKREKALMLLNRLTYETGGRVFFPDAGNTELKLYVPTILAGLYAQYTLGYYPASPLNTTPERKVEVKVAGPPNSASLKVIPDTFQFTGDLPQKKH
jgi:VWFA-related protein